MLTAPADEPEPLLTTSADEPQDSFMNRMQTLTDAISARNPESQGCALQALIQLLISRGMIDSDELLRAIETIAAARKYFVSASISGIVSVTRYWCSSGISGNSKPAIAATSRAHKPAALTTTPAWIVPLSVSTSQLPSARWRVASTGVNRWISAPRCFAPL